MQRHVEVILRDDPWMSNKAEHTADCIQISVNVYTYEFGGAQRRILDYDTAVNLVVKMVYRFLPRDEPLVFRVLVLHYEDEKFRGMLNTALTDMIAWHSTTAAKVRANNQVVGAGIIFTHFSADRVGSFIERAIAHGDVHDNIPDNISDANICHRILLSAGIHRVGAAMARDVYRAVMLDTEDKIRVFVHGEIGGKWAETSPWCIEQVVKFVMCK